MKSPEVLHREAKAMLLRVGMTSEDAELYLRDFTPEDDSEPEETEVIAFGGRAPKS